jgi:RNA polymerase sigma-70 factor (ECF subfamily)
MATENLSKQLLARFRDGDSQAAAEVFDRYVARLLSLARRRMSPRLQRRVDADDVVQSAMRSFFVRAANDDYVLQRAGDLWRLLAAITLSKLRRQVEVHTAAKRAVAKEAHSAGDDQDDLTAVAGHEPLPGEEAALMEELQRVMQLSSPAQREALQLRLTGETIESIAQSMGRSQRTVRRLLQNSRQELERRLATSEVE